MEQFKTFLIKHMPPDLHHLIKMQAVKEHKTMEQYILNALANAVTRAK